MAQICFMSINIQNNTDGAAGGRQNQTMIGKPFLSLIIPVYNENERLKNGIQTVVSYLKKQEYSWEILLVDDGSKREVALEIQELIENGEIPRLSLKKELRIIRIKNNTGKGFAIKTGVGASLGSVIVFCDIDMSVPIETLAYLLKKLKQFPVVVTSRRHTDSKILVHQPMLRELSGRIFTAISRLISNQST
jgi:dolichyl-phosphate beta-glucosyltransferase